MSLRKFEILEMIAKGGMAEVFRARTVGLEGFAKEVCVKKILPHLTQDDSFVTMFIDEAKLAATLNYANIVQVHDLCVSADREYFIVMEYVSGKDLSDVIRASQLAGREVPANIAAFIGREVCKGLYYAHTKTDAEGAPLRIIHRDISPQNILMSYLGDVKITDFGIAKASSSVNKTAVGILKGKYGYMSPEQARGEPLDHRSDLFNLGIVLYELLVGERCFAGASDYSTLNLMREAQVTPPRQINKNVPVNLEKIILKALKKSPDDRFQDAIEFEKALSDWARSEAGEVREPEAAAFMDSLFSSRTQNAEETTGVIQLSSVVGPEPEPDEPPQAAPPKAPSVRSEERADEPGREALERAKRKKARAAEDASSKELKRSSVPAPAPAPAPKSLKKSEAKPVEKKERKVARIKPKSVAKATDDRRDEKRRQKEEARASRKPVGRQELKPELTRLRDLGKSRGGLTAGALIVLVAGAGGVVYGKMQTRASSEEQIFREMEIVDREPVAPGPKETGYILIESKPPGAEVWLDGNKLADKTPLMVERPLSTKKHVVKLAKPGFQTLEAEFSIDPKADVTMLRKELVGEQGELVIWSQPSGLPAKVDGKSVGATPLSLDVNSGLHKVEIGGGGKREVVAKSIEVPAGGQARVNPVVPEIGGLAALILVSEPQLRVLVDDAEVGHTNDGEIPLEPGVKHKITLLDDKKKKHREFWVELDKGQKREIHLDLREAS